MIERTLKGFNSCLRRGHRITATDSVVRNRTYSSENRIRLYGFHTVEAILKNPHRKLHRLFMTKNAFKRLGLDSSWLLCPIEVTDSKTLEQILGQKVIHQGIMVETEPLITKKLEHIHDFSLIIVLDQITDPHNVGSIIRSAASFNASALITTARYSPRESGILAKVASGALESIDYITVRNLARTLKMLYDEGFQTLALDPKGSLPLEVAFSGKKIALILGAEGKGLRQKTKKKASVIARLDTPGIIKSLNVSNAAAIALYMTYSYLSQLK